MPSLRHRLHRPQLSMEDPPSRRLSVILSGKKTPFCAYYWGAPTGLNSCSALYDINDAIGWAGPKPRIDCACREAMGVSTRSSAGAGPSGLPGSGSDLDRRMSSRGTPRSMSSGALVEVCSCSRRSQNCPACTLPRWALTWRSRAGIL